MSEELKGNQFEGKETYVKDVFDEIAEYYDKMNEIMSIGMVKGWHKFMFKKAGDITGFKVCDIGCGTGELSFMAAERVGPTGEVTDGDAGAKNIGREEDGIFGIACKGGFP